MADGEDQVPASPPLPKRGSYHIDFDALDETSNPFESKLKLGSSPPIHSGSAAPAFEEDAMIDPFKPRIKLASSPPGSPRLAKSPNNNNIGDVLPGTVSSDVQTPAAVSSEHPAEMRQSAQVNPKKKKIIKKTKVQSKIRTPKSLKIEQENADESPVSASDESASKECLENVEDKPLTSTKKQLPSRKKTKSQDLDNSVIKVGSDIQSKMEDSERGKEKLSDNILDNDMPFDAAPEAMASSSEIDHHFVDHDDTEDLDHTSDGPWPVTRVQNDLSQHTFTGRTLGGGQSKALDPQTDSSSHSTSDLQVKSQKETARNSPSLEGTKLNRSRDELPAVSTPPQGKHTEGSIHKHPAARALETTQADNSLKVQENKNESSSEETQFYDAYEYPPVATRKAKLGQKSSTEMERNPNPEEGGDNKGTVVQLVQVLRYSQSDWNKMKQDLELNFQASLLNKERDWSLMLAERDKRIAALEESNRKVKHTNEDMRMIVAEFEKTISQLQAEKEKSKADSQKVVQNLESERDQAIEDLQSVESAFSDLHRRYEKSKSIIEGFKRNEEQLKQCVEDLQAKLKKSDLKLQSLRSQAEEKLDKANEDIEKMKKSTKADIVRLEAALKKAELRISSLEESLHRKEKENQELTAICDELIAKVGS